MQWVTCLLASWEPFKAHEAWTISYNKPLSSTSCSLAVLATSPLSAPSSLQPPCFSRSYFWCWPTKHSFPRLWLFIPQQVPSCLLFFHSLFLCIDCNLEDLRVWVFFLISSSHESARLCHFTPYGSHAQHFHITAKMTQKQGADLKSH